MYALNPHRASHRRHRRQMREEESMQENPIVGSIFALLIAAAVGGGGVYLYMKHRESTAVIADPVQIVQAKVNLSKFADPSNGITYNKSAETQTALGDITPLFTQGLVQFQAFINTLVPSDKDKLAQFKRETNITPPPLPLRTDGVLDPATFDWLVIAQG